MEIEICSKIRQNFTLKFWQEHLNGSFHLS